VQISILRHAIAVARGTPGYEDDSQRPLTPQGRRKLQRVVRGLRALRPDFDLILSSPYVRARDTATTAAAALKLKKQLKLVDELVAEADPARLIAHLRQLPARTKHVLLVGHEPFLSEFAGTLIGGKPPAALRLKKAGFCTMLVTGRLHFGRCAVLQCLLTPRQLAALG
jgi:phosphohistidine phosphatase